MINLAIAGDAAIDWDEWVTPLTQFSQASGLTVSLYDVRGWRQVGPLVASSTARMLATSVLWRDDGPGTALEKRIAARVFAGDVAEEGGFHGMRVCSLALTQFGQVYGVLVYGWRFNDFSSPMACERIGAAVGVSGNALWSEVRLESPVSEARLATYGALLQTLAGSIDRQRETIGELNRVNRARDLFLATVSHEMRTPLSALSMRIEVLLKTVPDLPSKVEAGLTAMRVHIGQEAAMIDDLIDAARTLTGQMSITRTPVVLGQVLRDALSTVEGNASEKHIVLAVTPPDHGDQVHLEADGRRLQQVLWNLLFNAIKFTPRGGTIRIDISQGAEQVEIAVSDSGQGIAADDLPHVFGAFNLQRHANAAGLGLGLYIARHLVELHEGSLSVASAGKDKGTTFTIRLPLG
ncbi:HAMP domain-containing histidine kinase [Massilia antarctica]|uniref:histidine kinase n=1 Tax=Massilia antarctica TaxID=2765360 RepID=A0AA48WHE3_9BURK|nr:HAMP domain-containing sensor histidine kinase [Massilia antarctica]QPI52755.1 HAMP domain-containing histidine kinase [Massilia antarctica]